MSLKTAFRFAIQAAAKFDLAPFLQTWPHFSHLTMR
jgi:hypothetical protein